MPKLIAVVGRHAPGQRVLCQLVRTAAYTVSVYSHVTRLEKRAVGAIQMPTVPVEEIRPGGCAEAERDVVHHILLQVL